MSETEIQQQLEWFLELREMLERGDLISVRDAIEAAIKLLTREMR